MSNTSRKASTVFILVLLLLDSLGVGIVMPIVPRIFGSFLKDVRKTSDYYGLLLGLYPAIQLVFAPILGGLSDRFGRRRVLLLSQLCTGLDYVFLAFAPSVFWFFVGRAIAGVAGSSFTAGAAYITDITPQDRRAQAFGLMGATGATGMILGAPLGGLLGGLDLRAPFFVAGGLALLNLCYGVFVLPESLRPELRRPFSSKRSNPLGAMKSLGRSPALLSLSGTATCGLMAQTISMSSLVLYEQERFGWSAFDVGVQLSTFGIAGAVVQGAAVRVAVEKLGERRVVLWSLLATTAGMVGVALATHGWVVYALVLPICLGGMAGPALQGLLTREVTASEQGELQGALGMIQSIAWVLGPIVGTWLFGRFAPESSIPHVPGAPFYAAALLAVAGFVLAARIFSRLPPRSPGADQPTQDG